MSQQPKTFRRIVTGHNEQGQSIITSDAPPDRTHLVGGPSGAVFFEVWNTRETPAHIDDSPDAPAEPGLVLAPPRNGTRIRVIDFPPEGKAIQQLTAAEAQAHFKTMGGENASSATGAPHPLMHKTQTLDYGIVLEGELTLILDKIETTIQAGDIVVQKGTNHAWANRSGKVCRVAFILIDGQFADHTK